MSKHTMFILIAALQTLLIAACVFRVSTRSLTHEISHITPSRIITEKLGLTDLALLTEARYTRHLSQADNFTAFQDLPASFEHFPAGSILIPTRKFAGTRIIFQKKGNHQ